MNRHLFTIQLEDWGMYEELDVTPCKLCAVFAGVALLFGLILLVG